MAGTVWSKFFWSDWETDPALRMCSFAAQGLWMRMLCIAARHNPIGYVAVAGRGLEIPDLVRAIGGIESEVRDLLGELDRNGVFSRDRSGRIYSRRMVRDAANRAKYRRWGKQGGNPSLRKQTEKPVPLNPPDKPRTGSWLNNSSSLPEKLPKEEKKESEVVPIRAREKSDWPAGAFDEFWDAYPHKVGKQAAVRSFDTVRRSARPPPWADLMGGLRRYVSEKPPDRPWCNPTTWLNQGRWEDRPANGPHNAQRPRNGYDKRTGHDAFFAGFASFAEGLDGDDPAAGGTDEEIPLGRVNIDL